MAKEKTDTKEKSWFFEDGFRILQGEQEFVSYLPGSSIRIWPSEEQYHYRRHYHSAVEIVLVPEGKVDMELGVHTVHVEKDQILIVPSEYPHSLSMEKESKRLIFLFEPMVLMNMRDIAHMSAALSKPILLEEDSPLRREITCLLLKINEIYQQRASMWNTQCYSYLLQIYALLCEDYLQEVPEQSRSATIDTEIMNSAMVYIRQNYMRPLSLEKVADFAGFSRFYFSRAFKQFTGLSFSSFLIQTRLEEAERVLVFSDRSIKDVAFHSGFSSIATFNRVFREYKKCSPTQYRLIYSERRNVEKEEQTDEELTQ